MTENERRAKSGEIRCDNLSWMVFKEENSSLLLRQFALLGAAKDFTRVPSVWNRVQPQPWCFMHGETYIQRCNLYPTVQCNYIQRWNLYLTVQLISRVFCQVLCFASFSTFHCRYTMHLHMGILSDTFCRCGAVHDSKMQVLIVQCSIQSATQVSCPAKVGCLKWLQCISVFPVQRWNGIEVQ